MVDGLVSTWLVRAVAVALPAFLLLLFALAPPLAAIDRDGVRVESLTLPDGRRPEGVPLLVRFREHARGPLPVVLVSHGLGGSDTAFEALSLQLADQGYAVIHVTHADRERFREAMAERGRGGDRQAFRRSSPQGPMGPVDPNGGGLILDRLADLRRILDGFREIEAKIPGLHLDRARIGIVGHSAGALTAALAVGAEPVGPDGRLHSFRDPRFKAAVLISPQGRGRPTFREDSWRHMDGPVLSITGSADISPIDRRETPETRQDPFRLSPPGDEYLLFIEGATHGSYQGHALPGETIRPEVLRQVADATAVATTAFFDAYLKGETDAKALLRANPFARLAPGKVRWERR